MAEYHLAEFNLARLREPLDAEVNREFAAVLEAVNRIAEVSPGFVWRLTDDDGQSSSYVAVFDDPLLVVNFSVWTDVESLRHFTYRSGHVAYFRRKSEWFEEGASRLVAWWHPAGDIPDVAEAVRRLDHLEERGPGPHAFTLASPFEPPN